MGGSDGRGSDGGGSRNGSDRGGDNVLSGGGKTSRSVSPTGRRYDGGGEFGAAVAAGVVAAVAAGVVAAVAAGVVVAVAAGVVEAVSAAAGVISALV